MFYIPVQDVDMFSTIHPKPKTFTERLKNKFCLVQTLNQSTWVWRAITQPLKSAYQTTRIFNMPTNHSCVLLKSPDEKNKIIKS